MKEHTGGDPRRSIELLWGIRDQRPRRGPKPRLTVAGVAGAAIDIADTEGLPALSMRRVAERLGVTAMSLYTYVSGKDELIDLMLDTVHGELTRPEDVEGGWRARLELIARETRAMYLRHPWLLQVATGRPVLGPNVIAYYDYELRAVDGIGLTDVEMDLVISLVADYVHGAVRTAVETVVAERLTGMSDREWWQSAGPALAEVLDPARFPVAARVGAAAGAEYDAAQDPERVFAFGLQRLLDGVAAFVQARRGRPR